ncbi:FlgD immunoglobulin-like domain containing protein [Guyparkeria sp.]|uniref:FlgD immunoglobulin-like domain containing protein n=1 Tax=Guyparkeria sp. TaxID=2035736 RepID=UPI0039705E07
MKSLLLALVSLALIHMMAAASASLPIPSSDNHGRAGRSDAQGPVMTTSEVMLAQDNFPESGVLDLLELWSNGVRFDRAENTATPPLNVPGDQLQVTITPSPGAELLEWFPPQLHWKMKANPMFDMYRASEYWTDREGVAYGWSLGGDTYAFDLPDTAFLYPGDVIHYYFEAEEWIEGMPAGVATLPADTTGFSDFWTTSPYPSSFIMRALPGLREDGMGGIVQPEILLWNDFGDQGGEDEWFTALDNLGYAPGQDYDIYYTNAPSLGAGNGLGGRAAPAQLAGYKTILYSGGDAGQYTITDNVVSSDPGDDIGLLDAWLQGGNRNLLLTGSNLACDLATNNGAAGTAFLDWPAITLATCDVSSAVGGQMSPYVTPVPGNPVIAQADCWFAFGGYPDVQEFDQVSLGPGTVLLAEFTDPGCTPGAYPGTVAASLAEDPSYGSRVIYLPYDLMDIHDPTKWLQAIPQRTRLLGDFLIFFGHPADPGNVAGVPDLVLSTAATAAIQPVSVFVLPDGSGDRLDDANLFGGGAVDATITLTLYDANYDPIAGYPAEDLWLETEWGSLRFCEGSGIADANTDANGMTTFSGPFRGGGHSDPGGGDLLFVMVAGDALASGPPLEIYFNSADINGDLRVDEADEDLFASDLAGGYNYRSDFNGDGVVNLSDATLFHGGFGASCESGVAAVDIAQIRRRCILHASYPNPFNPRTTIAFETPRREEISLRVFDLSGRLVRNLIVGEPRAPGRHEVVWSGRDDAGRQVASGTYFYRLEAGEFAETKRMMLLK